MWSCGDPIINSPVGMKWESTLTYTPYKDIELPAEEGLYDFTCTSHSTFHVVDVVDGEVVEGQLADGAERIELPPAGVYSKRLHTISGKWFEIRIGANMMQVSIRANDTDGKRSLFVFIGAPGGGEEFRFVQAPRPLAPK